MIVGYDKGATALKISAVEGERIIFAKRIKNTSGTDLEILKRTLRLEGFSITAVSHIGVTGVGAEYVDFGDIDAEVKIIPEIEASGIGGVYTGHPKNSLVVCIGTGTSIILMNEGKATHVGGTGVGCGTLKGLHKKLFGNDGLEAALECAENGDRGRVDTRIKDLFSGTDTLPPDLTASNLSKCDDSATQEDWCAGIVNMVLEVAGSHAAIAANGYGVDTIIVIGGIAKTNFAEKVFENFSRLYPQNYIIPLYADTATSIGAARKIMLENQPAPLCDYCAMEGK